MDLKELCDIQAEAGIIATLIYHSDFILHSDYLKPKYFYSVDNASFYWAIKELYNNKIINIDAFNISNMLNSNKAVKNAIEKYNLPSIQEYIDLCINVKRDTLEEYIFLVDKVVELAFKRDYYKSTVDFQNMCFDKSVTLS
jgi:replicative DNA helicase